MGIAHYALLVEVSFAKRDRFMMMRLSSRLYQRQPADLIKTRALLVRSTFPPPAYPRSTAATLSPLTRASLISQHQ